MALLDDILTWSETLPAWQRDALRRAFQGNGQLTPQDLADIRAMVEGTKGAPTPIPLTQAHMPTAGSGASTTLLGLSHLKHVNGFSDGRQLDLADKGITVIFGHNGAGKSGFARVLKQACHARDKSPVLPNAFAEASGAKPEAVVSFEVDGRARKLLWRQDDEADTDLKMVSVYDSQSAQHYISKEKPSTAAPFGLNAITAIINGQRSLRERIKAEVEAIHLNATQFASLQGTHAVGQHIARLGPDTDLAALEALSKLTPEEAQQIAELTAAIKGLDVEPEAIKHERLAQRLEQLTALAATAESYVLDKSLDKFAGLAHTELAATRADRLAQELLRGAHDPERRADALLPDTGGAEWKDLFKAAQAFSQRAFPDHAHHPATGHGEPCVLCQQPLTPDASARMERFREYVAADAAKNLAQATEAVVTARQKIDGANLNPVDEPTLADIRQSNPELADAVTTHQAAWNARRSWLANAYAFETWDAPRPDLPQGDALSTRLAATAKALRARAAQLRQAKDEAKIKELNDELKALTSRQVLSGMLPTLKVHVELARRQRSLTNAHAALNPKAASSKATALSEKHITEDLISALNEELANLGYDHSVRPIITSRTDGETMHAIKLDGTRIAAAQVLSEGEQRAVAFAFFLAESRVRGDNSTLVLDDPSTSLDHRYRAKMAERLMAIAKHRNIAIFTHDGAFLSDLQWAAAHSETPLTLRTIEWSEKYPGHTRPGLPWQAKSVDDQLAKIRQGAHAHAKSQNSTPNEDDEELIKSAYNKFRGAIELAVREVILQGTVQPFNDETKMDRLAGVAGFSIEDWDVITQLHDKCSRIIDGHHTPRERNATMPTPADLLRDITQLDDVLNSSKERAKNNNKHEAVARREKRRKAGRDTNVPKDNGH